MTSPRPVKVTIGVPVFNGGASIELALRSAMAQDFADLEILVVDNASTDETESICLKLAKEDERLRYVRNPVNIGQNQNFARVFELSAGEYLRWMGDDDSLDSEYVDACVRVMDADSAVSVVTTNQRYIAQDGTVHYEEYTGPRPTSVDPIERLDVMLRLLSGSRLWIDPIYSLIRRSHLKQTPAVQAVRFGDEILACQLALLGAYAHVDRALATRRWEPLPQGAGALRRYTGTGTGPLQGFFLARAQRLIMLGHLWRSISGIPGATTSTKAKGGVVLARYSGRLWARRAKRQIEKVQARIRPEST